MRAVLHVVLTMAALAGFTGTTSAQTPSPRACDAARRSGHPLPGCARPQPPPVPPRRLRRSNLDRQQVPSAAAPQTPLRSVVPPHGAPAEGPLLTYLSNGSSSRGESVFRRCQACHTAGIGGANSVGPNLWAVMGSAIASLPGYGFYSSALRARGGEWDWQTMDAWLASPRDFLPESRMTFAGISDPQDRADLMLFLNDLGGALVRPAAPAAAPARN